jgi:ATP-dependent helicase/DNAse subunit B
LIASIARSFEKKIFSAAQIESLARCGFQYFARRILQIAEIPDIETSLSAIERGAVLHKILFRFYDELSNANRLDNTEEELELLINVGKQVLDELGIEHDLFEVEKETILGTGNVAGTLELFLTKVQKRLSEFGFRPLKFEIGFGMKSGDGGEDLAPVRIGDIELRGKVDRIDSHSDGLMIFDYKTSSVIPGHKEVVDDKISPQLLLYLNALDQIVRSGQVDVSPPRLSGAAFISINRDKLLRADEGKSPIQFVVQSGQELGELRYNPSFGSTKKLGGTGKYPKTMGELLKGTELFVNEKVTEARAGRFNLTRFSREKVCRYCSYSEACRIALTGEGFAVEDSA